MIKCGDRVIIKKIHGFKWLQEAICWKTNSQFSHIEPIHNDNGDSIDFTYPVAIYSNISKYFNGLWRIWLLRPTVDFNHKQFEQSTLNLIGIKYDLASFLGFASNTRLQDKKKINCSEGVLKIDQESGILIKRNETLVSPQSYYEFMCAGLFELVWEKNAPLKKDFDELRNK